MLNLCNCGGHCTLDNDACFLNKATTEIMYAASFMNGEALEWIQYSIDICNSGTRDFHLSPDKSKAAVLSDNGLGSLEKLISTSNSSFRLTTKN